MAQKLQEAESTVAELRLALEEAQRVKLSSQATARAITEDPLEAYISNSPSVDDNTYAETAASTTLNGTESEAGSEKRLLSDLSLDENGKVFSCVPCRTEHD